MNPSRHKWSSFSLLITAMLLLLLMPASVSLVNAQESTAEPENTEVVVTEVATEAPSDEGIEVPPAEPTAESTAPAETTAEAESTEEVIELEPTATIDSFADNFDDIISDKWLFNGWEHSGGSLLSHLPNAEADISGFIANDFQLSVQLLIEAGNTALIAFRSSGNEYRTEFASNGSSRLYRDDVLVDSYIMQAADSAWFTVDLLVAGDTIAISVNGLAGIVYTDSPSLSAGTFAFRSGAGNTGTVSLDNLSINLVDAASVIFPEEVAPITVTPEAEITLAPELTVEPELTIEPELTVEPELTIEPESTVEAEVTAEPEITPEVTEEPEVVELTEDGLGRFPLALGAIAEMIADGNFDDAKVTLEILNYRFDNQNRLHLQIFPGDGTTTQELERFVNRINGRVDEINDIYLTAFIPLNKLVNVLENDSINYVTRPPYARSTGPTYGLNEAPAGTVATEGFDMLGLQDWHNAGFMGAAVRVGIVDTGFAGGASLDLTGPEFSCLSEAPNAADSQVHGLYVVQIICDVAPQATVIPYSVSSASGLAAAVYEAMFDNIDVLVITVDISEFAPGDGEGLGDGTDDPYEALALARAGGMVVFAAAGNYGRTYNISIDDGLPNTADTRAERYVTFQVTSTNTTPPNDEVARVYMRASVGDEIIISWNDWAPLGLGLSDTANLETFRVEYWQYNPADSNANTQLLKHLDFSTTPSFTRASLFANPSISFDVAGIINIGGVNPVVDGCPTVDNTTNATFDGTCNIAVRIFRTGGDSTVLMQVGLSPARGQIQRVDLGVPVLNETIKNDLEIIGLLEGPGTSLRTDNGTLARPADSPDVIAVGAVCANEANNFALIPGSSTGPIFGPDGTSPINVIDQTQSNTKPEILSVSYVSTSINLPNYAGGAATANCDGTFAGLDATGGFGGTSAAAAHAAGMTAVMLSNPSFRAQFPRTPSGVQAIQDYIESHAVELPLGNSANGYDYTYGAGFFILGSPYYTLSNTQNVNLPADLLLEADNPSNLLECDKDQDGTPDGNLYYVGQGFMNSISDGTLANPFTSIAFAINFSSPNDCIVVMPGEYVTPILIASNGANIYGYNNVTSLSYPETIIRVSGQYAAGTTTATSDGITFNRNGGIYIASGVSSTRIQGLSFRGALTLNSTTLPRQAIYALNTTGTIIAENDFGGITINNLVKDTFNTNPIILETGNSATVEGNTFHDNMGGVFTAGRRVSPVISVVDFGASTATSAVIRLNTINNNTASNVLDQASSNYWGSLIYASGSYTDVVANTFLSNTASTLISGHGTTQTVRIVSNLFQNNTLLTTGATTIIANQPAGAIVQLNSETMPLSFVNNTVVGNDFRDSDNRGGILGRGTRVGILDPAFFDFVNNLVFDNQFDASTPRLMAANILACDNSLGADAVRNNWWHNYNGTSCTTEMAFGANNNITGANPSTEFIGSIVTLENGTANPLYYALGIINVNTNTFSQGVDASDLDNLDGTDGTTVIATELTNDINFTAYPFDRSVNDETRIFNISGHGADTPTAEYIDIGAFEYVVLSIVDADLDVLTTEDTPLVVINLASNLSGGFGALSFSFDTLPTNFGTQCGTQYTNNNGVIFGSGAQSERVFYCLPRDFYTQGLTAPYPDEVLIAYTVSDQSGMSASGNIHLDISPLPDADMDAVVNFTSDDFVVVGNIGQQNIRVRLRPFVNFGNGTGNFRFSERGNDDFLILGQYAIDYPFTYSNVSTDGAAIFDGTPIITPADPTSNNAAFVEFDLFDNIEGIGLIHYTVTDANFNSQDFTIKVRSIARIPTNPGIYDDSSFAFDYSTGGWSATTDTGSINNTLHTSNVNGAVAGFGIRGTGFVLYMKGQGGTRGGNFGLNLYINSASTPTAVTNWSQIGTTNVYSAYASDANTVFFCTTDAIKLNLLSSTVNDAYTITCNGFLYTDSGAAGYDDNAAEQLSLTTLPTSVHLVDVVNLSTKTIAVDAFSLLDDNETPLTDGVPLAPGFHDVDELELRNAFSLGWIETPSSSYSNGRAYVLTGPATAPVSFLVSGGTGFAIETTQETQQVTYQICVTNISSGLDELTCQRFDYLTPTRLTNATHVFRPFYGLSADPSVTYRVDIVPSNIPTGVKFVIDGVTVFEPIDAPTSNLIGAVDDSQLEYFVFGGGTEDNWDLNSASRGAVNETLTSISRTVRTAGSYIAFETDSAIDTVYWTYSSSRPTTVAMVCVDRGQGVGTNSVPSTPPSGGEIDAAQGNCIIVNLQTGDFWQAPTTGTVTLLDAPDGNIQLTKTTIILDSDDFRTAWGNANDHTFEIFSLYDTALSLDQVVAIGSTVALTEGRYEEYTQNIQYLSDTAPETPASIGNSESSRVSDYALEGTDFVQVFGNGASRDFGGGVMYTTLRNSVISFRFTGTGFAPSFRLQNTAEEINVCWISGTTSAANTLANGVCQRFDNGESRTTNNALRPIMGLQAGTYTVAMQFVGDNFSPSASRTLTPELWFDGVVIYNDDLTALDSLSIGVLHEGNFLHHVERNQFDYFGNAWTTDAGSRARNFSNSDVDSISRGEAGATVAFRTNGANALVYTRSLSTAYAPFLLCATNVMDYTDRHCQTIDNTGRSSGNTITIYLTDDTTTPFGNYIVTMSSLNGGGVYFDAVKPMSITDALTEGQYDENDPHILYNYGSRNLVLNGDMEVDNGAVIYWANVDTPVTNAQASGSGVFYTGRYSRAVTTDAVGEGIESLSFDLQAGQTYTFLARVRVTSPSTSVTFDTPCAVDPQSDPTRTTYQTLRCDFTAPGNSTETVSIISDNAITSFNVDDVQVVEGAQWLAVSNRNSFGGYTLKSTTHGAEIRFGIAGTGFGIGLVTGNTAGAMEVCYVLYNPASDVLQEVDFSGADCITFENEVSRANSDTMRIVEGLAQDTYAVRVRDAEDGDSVLKTPAAARSSRSAVGQLEIDYILVFDNSGPEITSSGSYSESAVDSGGGRYLQLLPENRWGTITGRAASRYSDGSYVAVLDSRLAASRSTAGGVAMLYLNGGSETRVVLDVLAASSNNSDQLLACVDGADGVVAYDYINKVFTLQGSTHCTLITSLKTSRYVYLTPDNLPLLGNAGAHTLTVQTLSTGTFTLDDYQVLFDADLLPGYYEEGLVESLGTVGGAGTWVSENNNNYSGGSALVVNGTGTATLSFDFTGTGISVVSALLTNGGTIQVDVAGGVNANSGLESTDFSAVVYGNSYSIAGLPSATYTVTITANALVGEKVVLDAVEVYGTLQQLGSLYDDAQTDANGVPYITYGPSNDSWQLKSGSQASSALNQTLHFTQTAGAVASFQMNDARGIVLYYGAGNAGTVEVCFRDVATPTSVECLDKAIGTTAGNAQVLLSDFVTPFVTGDYFVTITTTVARGTFQLDAVQVLEAGLHEGIFTGAEIAADSMTVNGGTVNGTGINLGSGQSLAFEMTGVAYSLVIESGSIANISYTMCVEDGGGSCNDVDANNDIINDDVNNYIIPAGSSALSYAGLQDGNGDERTVTVRITNDGTGTLRIAALHVLSGDPSLNIVDTSRYENTDARIRYLPFGSLLNSAATRGNQSQGSEHTGSMQGSVVYFEFTDLSDGLTTDPGFEYIRQVASNFGQVEVCYGQVADGTNVTVTESTTDASCETFDNTASSTSYQVAAAIVTNGYCEFGCWATIRNLSNKQMPFDFVRIFDAGAALSAGYYEDSYPSLNYDDSDGGATWGSDPLAFRGASDGFVAQAIASDFITSEDGAALWFVMQGTGFSIDFALDAKSDMVEICYAEGTQTNYAGVKNVVLDNGICQTFDNEARGTKTDAQRTFAGLPTGIYTVAVRMLPDNLYPRQHSGTSAPISMNIDSVEIYNETWTSLDALTVGRRYETNYNNRLTDNRFIYIGDTWTTQQGSRARQNSASNYDETREYGAGIVFRTTNNADAMTLYVNLKRGNSPIRVCAVPVNAGLTAITGEVLCQDYLLDGSGSQQPLTFRFHDFGLAANADYLISVSSLLDSSIQLDAIELSNTSTLTAGFYEGTNVNLYYDNVYEDFVVNGNMEVSSDLVDYWGFVGNPSKAEQGTTRYEGRYGWHVEGNVGTGIQSLPITLTEATITYTAIARVRVISGTARLRLVQGSSPVSLPEFRVLTQNAGPNNNDWTTIRVDFQLNPTLFPYNDLHIQIVANSANSVFDVDDVHLTRGGTWLGSYNRSFSNGSVWESQSAGSSMFFSFTGTGFELGTVFGRNGGEMEVCYDTNAVFGDSTDSCFSYQNEDKRDSNGVSRSITGLPSATYFVRLRDDEDGSTAFGRRLNASRNSRNPFGKIAVDYIRIFDDLAADFVPARFFNEDAVNPANGDAYLQLYPSQDWGVVEGRNARGFTGESYYTVLDSRGRAARTEAGQSAVLYVDVPDEGATVVLYTGSANRSNSSQVLVCAGDEMSGAIGQTETQSGSRFTLNFVLNSPTTPSDCVIRDTSISTAISVGPDDLAALGTPGPQRVMFTSLATGQFIIDGYQVIYGNTLTAGIYDSFMPDNLLNFDSSSDDVANRDDRGCNVDFYWCTVKTRGSFGDTVLSTQDIDAVLNFDIEGTGFSVMTNVGTGVQMRICYTQTPSIGEAEFPAANAAIDNTEQDLTLGGVWCDLVTTNTNSTVWNNINAGRRVAAKGTQYGWAYYGLPYGNYSVEVRMREVITGTNRSSLDIDAIVVFGDYNEVPIMSAGFYDDTLAPVSYEPFTSWTNAVERSGPPRGPYNSTDISTRNAGSIAQMRVDGNAVTLFQTFDSRNTADARICVIVTEAVIHCTEDSATTAYDVINPPVSPAPPYALAFELANFSQSGRKTYFAPITFYGLGPSDPSTPHRVIIENRDHLRELNIDAILVQD